MKTKLLVILIIFFSFFSCDLFNLTGEPSYTTKIAWNSGLFSNAFDTHMVDGDSVFFYERPSGYTTSNIYVLTRLNAETGELIWRGNLEFRGIVWCQPIVIDGYVYVFLAPAYIVSFDYETGKHTATVKISIDNNYKSELSSNPVAYQQYLYLSLWSNKTGYFSRLDVNLINQSGDADTIQLLAPELIWKPAPLAEPASKPIIHNNIIYVGTNTGGYTEVELAGFDIDTKERVFYETFGGPEDGDVPFPEKGGTANNIIIHDNVLYYISWSVAAWDLKTGERLYRHVFSWNTPNEKIHGAAGLVQAEYHKGRLYYTNGSFKSPQGFRNIHCIDAKTGNLVWNDVRSPFSLDSNVIIAHDLLYVTQSTGLLVYKPETGKLIGMDKSFHGTDLGRNVLYKDYMICVIKDEPGIGEGRLAAVYVGR